MFFKHLFLPTEKNNYRAKILHNDVLSLFLLIAILFNFLAKSNSKVAQVLGFATDITVNKLLYYTNQERINNNLTPLKLNPLLSKAAEKKALDMFEKNYWAHYAPDGKAPWDFILEVGYEYEYAGENLAKNFMFSKDVIKAWMRSPTHRENMLKKEYTDVGFAVVNGVLQGEETTLIVQFFGKPINKNVTYSYPNKKPSNISSNTEADKLISYSKTSYPSPKKASYLFAISFIILLIITLMLDYYIAIKLNLIRNTSNTFLTFLFITTILAGLFIIKNGITL